MKKHSLINTMKTLYILAILFLVIAVSHANTNSDDNNQDAESSSLSNLGHNPLIQTSDLDLTELLNRRRVNLRNRFRVPFLTRYIPGRCRRQRFTRFGPGVRVDPKDDLATIMTKQAEVIRHRHVAGKFDPTVELKRDAVVYEVKEEYDGEWKAGHHHHHHHHHHDHSDDSDDHSDDSDDEGHKLHHEVHAHRFNHHGHKKKKGNYIIGKIRKFLSFF